MTIAVLLVLVALWLVVLAPPALRFFSGERRRADSVGDFNEALSVLGRTNGHRGGPRVDAGPTMTPAQRRRRDILVGLLGAVLGSLLLALLFGGPLLWGIQIVVDLLLVAYVGLLVHFRQRSMERHAKVRYLPARGARRSDRGLERVASVR